ncbi:hypothetical protein CCACVL1_05339 [Corchorus capsularis]|uniref:Uncharacterized protein n=1 Tax=Corchorus capsularis TaxID=210143 RepID=A0A1R3JLD3_COCAP|nr:hypothetical protein CCACVL1_05339 [Corchorus capsularis]
MAGLDLKDWREASPSQDSATL